MKKIVPLLFIIIFTSACDSPQRNRMINNVGMNGVQQPSSTSSNPWGTPGTTSGTTTETTTGTTSGPSSGSSDPQRPAGFVNCDLSAKHYAAVIGYIGICQSTLDETSVAVNSTITDTNRTCLIPTYKDQSGSSTYLGQPQCFAPQQGVVTMGKLYKSRSGFGQHPINGIMIMKERSLGAYFTCMDAYVTFTHPQCPYGAKTSPYCDQMARNLMSLKCNNFKMDNPYLDLRLK
jgi:hypothetical protein